MACHRRKAFLRFQKKVKGWEGPSSHGKALGIGLSSAVLEQTPGKPCAVAFAQLRQARQTGRVHSFRAERAPALSYLLPGCILSREIITTLTAWHMSVKHRLQTGTSSGPHDPPWRRTGIWWGRGGQHVPPCVQNQLKHKTQQMTKWKWRLCLWVERCVTSVAQMALLEWTTESLSGVNSCRPWGSEPARRAKAEPSLVSPPPSAAPPREAGLRSVITSPESFG